jgi:hypothetical protein
MNNGQVIAAAALASVLAGEAQELIAPPDRGSTMHGQPQPSTGPHLDYRLPAMPSGDVTVEAIGQRMTLAARTVQAVSEPSASV